MPPSNSIDREIHNIHCWLRGLTWAREATCALWLTAWWSRSSAPVFACSRMPGSCLSPITHEEKPKGTVVLAAGPDLGEGGNLCPVVDLLVEQIE